MCICSECFDLYSDELLLLVSFYDKKKTPILDGLFSVIMTVYVDLPLVGLTTQRTTVVKLKGVYIYRIQYTPTDVVCTHKVF